MNKLHQIIYSYKPFSWTEPSKKGGPVLLRAMQATPGSLVVVFLPSSVPIKLISRSGNISNTTYLLLSNYTLFDEHGTAQNFDIFSLCAYRQTKFPAFIAL